MFYGFYDADFNYLPKSRLRPNLEISKLNAYYREKGDLCRMITDFTDLEKFDKVFIRNNYGKEKTPSSVLLRDNVDWGGLYYSNGVYVPFENFEIEKMAPNPGVYLPLTKERQKKMTNPTRYIREFFSCRHTRLFANGEYVGHIKDKADNSIFIHDTLLSENEGWFEKLVEQSSLTIYKLHLMNPIPFNDFNEDFENFLNASFMSLTSIIHLNKSFSTFDFRFFVKEYEKFLQSNRVFYLQLGYVDIEDYNLSSVKNTIFEVVNHIFYARSKRIKMRTYLYEHNVPVDYKTFLLQLRNWINYPRHHALSYIGYLKEKKSKTAIDIANEIMKGDDTLEKLLNTPLETVEKGGTWYYD